MIDLNREAERAEALSALAILDTPPEREFDALAALARHLFATKASSFTLIDAERQWFKARCGMRASETARAPALCTWVVEHERALVVPDATTDVRFAASPLLDGDPKIRFYAGVPVSARHEGGIRVPVGTLCVIDDQPRDVGDGDIDALKELACLAEALLDARMTANRALEIAAVRGELNSRLSRERGMWRQAERIADLGSWRLSVSDGHIDWSDGAAAMHEMPAGTRPSFTDALSFFPETDRQNLEAAVRAAVADAAPFDIEADFETGSGDRRRIRCMGEVEVVEGQTNSVLGVIQDITARHRMERELLRLSRTDDLTGLANRAEFNRVLDERLEEAETSGGDLVVLLIDLDGFKPVNDRLGHAMGDEVLRRVGERLGGGDLSGCFAARLGGDEFAMIVPGTVDRRAFDLLLESVLRELRIWVGDRGRRESVSGTVGCAWLSDTPRSRADLLRCADMALYKAKRSQKGTACTYSPPVRLELVSGLAESGVGRPDRP